MRRHWAGSGWTEEKERAFQEDWARRILTCPKKRCRRLRACADPREGRCPGLTTIPFTEADNAKRIRAIYVMLRNRYNDIEAGVVVSAEERKAEEEWTERVKEEAFEKVRQELAAGPCMTRSAVSLSRPSAKAEGHPGSSPGQALSRQGRGPVQVARSRLSPVRPAR